MIQRIVGVKLVGNDEDEFRMGIWWMLKSERECSSTDPIKFNQNAHFSPSLRYSSLLQNIKFTLFFK